MLLLRISHQITNVRPLEFPPHPVFLRNIAPSFQNRCQSDNPALIVSKSVKLCTHDLRRIEVLLSPIYRTTHLPYNIGPISHIIIGDSLYIPPIYSHFYFPVVTNHVQKLFTDELVAVLTQCWIVQACTQF